MAAAAAQLWPPAPRTVSPPLLGWAGQAAPLSTINTQTRGDSSPSHCPGCPALPPPASGVEVWPELSESLLLGSVPHQNGSVIARAGARPGVITLPVSLTSVRERSLCEKGARKDKSLHFVT